MATIKNFVKENRGLIAFLVVFITLCAIYPVYFISDDWEHLNLYHQGRGAERALFWTYRVPSMVVLHMTFFPLFVKNLFFLGKFTLWLFLFTATIITLSLYIKDFFQKFRSSIIMGLFPIVLAFPPNNYEWSFWPTNMTLFPALTLIAWVMKMSLEKPQSIFWNLFRAVIYAVGFYTYETILPMMILIELSWILYFSHPDKNFFKQIFQLIKQITPGFILIFFSRMILHSIAPYPYGGAWGFQPHLFEQFLAVTFITDYYKMIFASGTFLFIGMLLLAIIRLRQNALNFIRKDLLILLAYFVGSSYYFIIMFYSSRRALGGQLYFFWGWILLGIYFAFQNQKVSKSLKRASLFLIILPFLAHQTYVFQSKRFEQNRIETNAQELHTIIKNAKEYPVKIDDRQPLTGFKRAWNFAIRPQVDGYLRHYLSKEELEKVELDK